MICQYQEQEMNPPREVGEPRNRPTANSQNAHAMRSDLAAMLAAATAAVVCVAVRLTRRPKES